MAKVGTVRAFGAASKWKQLNDSLLAIVHASLSRIADSKAASALPIGLNFSAMSTDQRQALVSHFGPALHTTFNAIQDSAAFVSQHVRTVELQLASRALRKHCGIPASHSAAARAAAQIEPWLPRVTTDTARFGLVVAADAVLHAMLELPHDVRDGLLLQFLRLLTVCPDLNTSIPQTHAQAFVEAVELRATAMNDGQWALGRSMALKLAVDYFQNMKGLPTVEHQSSPQIFGVAFEREPVLVPCAAPIAPATSAGAATPRTAPTRRWIGALGMSQGLRSAAYPVLAVASALAAQPNTDSVQLTVPEMPDFLEVALLVIRWLSASVVFCIPDSVSACQVASASSPAAPSSPPSSSASAAVVAPVTTIASAASVSSTSAYISSSAGPSGTALYSAASSTSAASVGSASSTAASASTSGVAVLSLVDSKLPPQPVGSCAVDSETRAAWLRAAANAFSLATEKLSFRDWLLLVAGRQPLRSSDGSMDEHGAGAQVRINTEQTVSPVSALSQRMRQRKDEYMAAVKAEACALHDHLHSTLIAQDSSRPASSSQQADTERWVEFQASLKDALEKGTTDFASNHLLARCARLLAVTSQHHLSCAEAITIPSVPNACSFAFVYGEPRCDAGSVTRLMVVPEGKSLSTNAHWVEPCAVRCLTFSNAEHIVAAYGGGGWDRLPLTRVGWLSAATCVSSHLQTCAHALWRSSAASSARASAAAPAPPVAPAKPAPPHAHATATGLESK